MARLTPEQVALAALARAEQFATTVAARPMPATDPALMPLGVELMKHVLICSKVMASLAPRRAAAFSRSSAPLVGLVVRMCKLYEGILDQVCKRREELALVFVRPLMEARTKFDYIRLHGRSAARSFMEGSFRAEKEILAYIDGLAKSRQLVPIERRIRTKILAKLKTAGVTRRTLGERRQWDLDGKSMRALLGAMNRDLEYAFGFGSASHHVHGTWSDLIAYHLERRGGGYLPALDFDTPSPAIVVIASKLMLAPMHGYISHFQLERGTGCRRVIRSLDTLVNLFNGAVEAVRSGPRASG